MIWQKKCHHNKQRWYVTLTISTLLHRESYNKRYNILFMTFHYDKHITSWKQSLLFLSKYNTAFSFPPQQTESHHKKHKQTINNFHKWNLYMSKTPNQPMAYFWVQLRAVASYLVLSVLYIWAISGTRGSSGFGSVSSEQIESSTWYAKQNIIIIIELNLKFVLIYRHTVEWIPHSINIVINCLKKLGDRWQCWNKNKILNSCTT